MNMKLFIIAVCLFFGSFALSAQEQKQPDIYQQAETEADRLQRLLELEDWQVFYVDSTLKHDYQGLMVEAEKLQASKVANTALYVAVQDKWMERIEASYKKIFNETQWAAYLKSGAAKAQKAREKRKAKAAGK